MGKPLDEARDLIQSYVDDINWDDPFWMDDVQEQFPTLSASELEEIYSDELKNKLASENADGLERMYQEQMDASPESRNYVMVDVIENLLSSMEPRHESE